jgi:hypothetical protein
VYLSPISIQILERFSDSMRTDCLGMDLIIIFCSLNLVIHIMCDSIVSLFKSDQIVVELCMMRVT